MKWITSLWNPEYRVNKRKNAWLDRCHYEAAWLLVKEIWALRLLITFTNVTAHKTDQNHGLNPFILEHFPIETPSLPALTSKSQNHTHKKKSFEKRIFTVDLVF